LVMLGGPPKGRPVHLSRKKKTRGHPARGRRGPPALLGMGFFFFFFFEFFGLWCGGKVQKSWGAIRNFSGPRRRAGRVNRAKGAKGRIPTGFSSPGFPAAGGGKNGGPPRSKSPGIGGWGKGEKKRAGRIPGGTQGANFGGGGRGTDAKKRGLSGGLPAPRGHCSGSIRDLDGPA